MKKLAILLCAFLFLPHDALATQSTFVVGNFPTVSPYAGLTLVQNINTAMSAITSQNAGASAPSYAVADMFWPDTTSNILKFTPDGSTWLPVGKFSGSQWMPYSNGVPATIPASTGSSNSYIVTYSPAPTALVVGQHYPFIANFQNTSTATLNVNTIGAHPLTKNGAVALASSDIASAAVVDDVWDGTEFQITSQSGNTTGTAAIVLAQSPTINQPNLVGTATNDNAATGSVGEDVLSIVPSASSIPLTTATPLTITSITLSAGDWDIDGTCAFATNVATTTTLVVAGISPTTNSFSSVPLLSFAQLTFPATTGGAWLIPTGRSRLSLSGSTTEFLVCQSNFAVSNTSAYGGIEARRIR